MSILAKNGKMFQLLDRLNSISEDEMKNEKTKRTPKEYNLARNMNITVW